MNNRRKRIEIIRQKIHPVLRKFRVSKAGLFGSFARGEEKKDSDIDILVEVGNDWDLFDLINLKLNLEKKMKRKVDVVEYQGIRKELRKTILSDEIPIIA
ncbi:MAG: nucleotidyltransferase family protein [Nanoarchaeota archaeon]